MQLIPIYLFTIICGYSLVISAPVNQPVTDTQETKQQKATVIASRLLKELANEEHTNSQDAQLSSDKNEDEKKHEEEKKVEYVNISSNEDKQDDQDSDESQILNELYQLYENDNGLNDDESSEIDDDDYLYPITKQQLLEYLDQEQQLQDQRDEQSLLVPHKMIMDEDVMQAENRRRRRRRSFDN